MDRVKLSVPPTFPFQTTMEVRVGDLNYGNHLSNVAVLAFAHEGRLRFLAEHGFSELDFGGVGLIMADAAVQYRAEAFLGDLLTVQVAATDAGKVNFNFYYRLAKQDKEVALVKTGMVCFDYQVRKVASLPSNVFSIFEKRN